VWTEAQDYPKDEKMGDLMKEKLADIDAKGYIEKGHVHSLMFFFAVAKGLTDVRMVYDGTKSGLNACMWAPWFPLPTVDDLLDVVEPGTYMADNDAGEMFLNFIMHEDLKKLCGIDLTAFLGGEAGIEGARNWWRWCRNAMGSLSSPYLSVQASLWADEKIMGDRHDETNVYRWDRVSFNLPGSPGYNPGAL
jgi:hypothetical protein